MVTRPPRPGAKPGATRQQIERRERFERARRDSLRPAVDGPVVMYGWHTVTAALRNPARRPRLLLATENAARRLTEEGVTSPHRTGAGAAVRDRRAADARRGASGALSAKPICCPRLRSKICRLAAWCWCSTRLPTRTMSAPSSVRRRPLRRSAIVTTATAFARRHRCAGQGRIRRARICAAGQRAKSRARARRA